MDYSEHRLFRTLVCVGVLTAIAAGVFWCTVELRRPWFGTVGKAGTARFLTNSLVFAKQWRREGMWNLHAGMYYKPRSIESPELDSMQVVRSYPPGAVLPLQLMATLLRREPTLGSVMAYNLFTHFLTALLLSLTVFAFLRQTGRTRVDASLLSLIPIFVYLLLPGALYQHQMRYFADHAVIVLFAVYVFLEVLRDSVENKKLLYLLSFLQGLVAFLGILTDYLFALVALCVYVKRLARREMGKGALGFVRKSVLFWLPLGLGVVLFAVQLYFLLGFEDLVFKFKLWGDTSRGGLPSLSTDTYFWKVHLVNAYGKAGIALLWASLACFAIVLAYSRVRLLTRKETNPRTTRALALAFMLLAPCFIHAFFLKNHSAIPVHDFSVLKFAVPLATVPFVLAPLLVLSCFRVDLAAFSFARAKAFFARREAPAAPRWSLLPLALLALAAGFLYLESPRIRPLFTTGVQDDPKIAVAQFIGANTGYEDVVFACDSDLMLTSGRYLPFSMKEVHGAPSLTRIYVQVAHLDDNCVVNLLTKQDDSSLGAGLGKLAARAHECRSTDGLRLYKMPKADFAAMYMEGQIKPPRLPPRSPSAPRKPRRAWKGQRDLVQRLTEMGVDIDKLKDSTEEPEQKEPDQAP